MQYCYHVFLLRYRHKCPHSFTKNEDAMTFGYLFSVICGKKQRHAKPIALLTSIIYSNKILGQWSLHASKAVDSICPRLQDFLISLLYCTEPAHQVQSNMMIFMHLLNVLKLYITQLKTNKTTSLFIDMVPKEKKERKNKNKLKLHFRKQTK